MKKKDVIDLINFNDYLSPEYGPELTNHLPMAIVALNELGASEQQIQDFTKNHIKQRGLRALKRKSKIVFTEANYTNFLSQRDYYFAHDRFFTRSINKNGRDETLSRHIDFLMSGVCGATFHGLLRTAYGVASDNDAEISKGLAYWADTYMKITDHPAELSNNGVSLKELFEKAHNLHQQGHFSHVTAGSPNIFSKIDAVAQVDEFQNLISTTPLNSNTTLDEFRDISLNMFQTEDSFTSLHCITASHALRTLFNHVQNPESTIANAGHALVATYLSMGAPKLVDPPQLSALKEGDLPYEFDQIRQSSNDHAIKLAYTALEEYRDTGKDDYLHIIKNMVKPKQP